MERPFPLWAGSEMPGIHTLNNQKAIAAGLTFRALADRGLLRKDYLNGDAGGGGVYTWESREAAEGWYTPEWFDNAEKSFGARPVVTYYETYVTVDNVNDETIVRDE